VIESSVIAALARLVAKDGRLDNFKVRTYVDGTQTSKPIDFQTAINEGLAFFVDVSNKILAIDFDTESGIQLAQEIAKLAGVQDRAVVCTSGSDGHAHLWVRVTNNERVKITRIAEIIEARERTKNPAHTKKMVDVRTSMRPPLSPHRQGKPVSLVGITEGDAINRLAEDHTVERLNKALQATEDRYKILFFIACEYVRRNRSEAQYIEDVLANPIGGKAEQRKNPEVFLKQAYKNAYQRVTTEQDHKSSNRPEIEAWEAEARRKATLSGNRNLLTTIKEIADIAKRSNKTEPNIAVRDILTCTHSTAQRHLSKLQAIGVLTTVQASNRRQMKSATYKLKCEGNGAYRDGTSKGGCLPCVSQNIRIYQALHGKQAAYRVLEVIAGNKGITAREIAVALNYKTVRSVQIQIKFLIGIGVIEGYGKQYKVARMDDQHLESIANQRGTSKVIETRQAQNARDRWQYAASVAAYEQLPREEQKRLRKAKAQQRQAKREAQKQKPSTQNQDPWQKPDWFIPTVRPAPTGGYAYTS